MQELLGPGTELEALRGMAGVAGLMDHGVAVVAGGDAATAAETAVAEAAAAGR